ncbi:PREDICTED: uncharacterized protein LOC104610588 isoform X2 [Nelumbo nucifera]|uniref:Uncharacterized protein LOC104610588 isoform X2 n=1 Tax=Nelumbo nucifera TaxID=4432 RepID=A0A1U8BGB2_NELNU|nr:PREDICTED: uncharacterized protein LOC104610588 isoform X2 [Nelumbo nucifera]
MWGDGGRLYWGRKEGGKVEGIVVVFAWISSQEKHVRSYVQLYSSLGWNSLVCHSEFFNLFFPERATSLAFLILNELAKELKVRPSPVVFAAFSGGPKACMYKVLQIIDGKCEGLPNLSIGGPFLIFCSEDDELAPFQTICNFAQRLQDLGADVKLVKWNGSPHVGHYRHYPTDYKAAVTELLGKAALVYSRRIQQLEGERMGVEGLHDGISKSICTPRKAAASSSQSLSRVAIGPSDHSFFPSSVEYQEGRDVGSLQDEQKEGLIHVQNPPSINAYGVLGQILFDVCVPKNIEGWDIRSGSLNGQPPSAGRHVAFNPIKCIRRSRL